VSEANEAQPRRAESVANWVFLGPRGLRAGWAVLLFAMSFGVLLVGMQFVVAPYVHLNRDMPLTPATGLLVECAQLAPAVVATWLMALLERRPRLYYGYQGKARAVRLVSGLVLGFVAISVVVLVLRALGYLTLERGTLAAGPALENAALWGVVFLLVGFAEETIFRGYVQYTLARGMGFWWGALLVAVLFGTIHRTNPGESPVGLLGAGAAGLIFCLSLWYTGSLWWAVGFHAAWDWGQSYFYGTADSGMMAQGHLLREHAVGPALWSGGTTGPEGSVIVFPLLLVVALLMVLWWGRRSERPFAGGGWRPWKSEVPEGAGERDDPGY